MKTRNADDDGTVLVPDPRLQDCYDQCRVTAQGAAATIMLTIGAAALAMSFWCLACILIALAGATVTGPLVISLVAGKCAYACMWAAGALAGLALALANAVTQRRICEKNCALQFPPIPKPPPRPPGPIAAGSALGVHG